MRRAERNHRVWWAAYILLVITLVASAWVLTVAA
jgi:ABC-type multidrug transport system permease subunit